MGCVIECVGKVVDAAPRALIQLFRIDPAMSLGKTHSQTCQLLIAIDAGDKHASDELLTLLYDELRRMAAGKLMYEAPGITLQATALVHEAYLKLLKNVEQSWKNRSHFLAHASEAMRRILVDAARRRKRVKRGGGLKRVGLEGVSNENARADHLLELDHALSKLEKEDPIKAKLVKLRFFGGFTVVEAAEMLEISKPTAERYWAFSRSWLHHEMQQGSEGNHEIEQQ